MPTTKTQQVVDAIASGDNAKALRIAKTFRLGLTKNERDQIARGHECNSNAAFYEQLGRDPQHEIAEALRIVNEKIVHA